MAKKRRRRRAPPELLLTGIDRLCEGVASLCMAVFRGAFALVRAVLRALLQCAVLILRALLSPFALLLRAYRRRHNAAWRCRRLTGEAFEAYFAKVLCDNGFRDVELTRASGDQGVDILAWRNGKRYAIQCKNYAGAVGNAAVQEAFAGARYYDCDIPVVVCPGQFTRAARDLAASTGVRLWDERQLTHMMRISGRPVA